MTAHEALKQCRDALAAVSRWPWLPWHEERIAREALAAADAALSAAPVTAETVTLVGVKNGIETVIGEVPMPPNMKARELVREMFGAWEPDDGSDPDLAMAVCEQLIEWMGKQARASLAAPAPAAPSFTYAVTAFPPLPECSIISGGREFWNEERMLEFGRAVGGYAPAPPPELSKIDAEYWIHHRSDILGAITEAGFSLCSSATRFWLQPLAPAPARAVPLTEATSSIDHWQQCGYLGTPDEWREACRLFRARCAVEDCERMAKLRTYIEDGLLIVVRPGITGEQHE